MQDDLEKALEVLLSGGTILFPHDAVWSIGCDATNAKAVEKIHRIKFGIPQKSMILLANSIEMISEYVDEVPDTAYDLMMSFKDSITFVYDNVRNIARNVIDEDGTVGIKIPKDEFCLQLITMFGRPISSSTANISGDQCPVSFNKINPKIKAEVDYICKTNHESINTMQSSTIIRMSKDGNIEIVRT